MKYGNELLIAYVACAFGCEGNGVGPSDGGGAGSLSSGVRVSAGDASADGAPDGTVTNDASGCPADTQTDPSNCGTCGHNCLGGACQAGACQPVVLVSGTSLGVSSFAIDSTSVYWTQASTGSGGPIPPSGIVSKCPIAGCTSPPTTLATAQAYPQGIWVGGPNLYWLDDNAATLMQCSVDCNDNAMTFHQWSGIGPGGFAATATGAFLSSGGIVYECPASGCASPATFASGQATPVDIVLSGADVYWINGGTLTGGKAVQYVDGGVMTCPVEGCDGGPTTLASGLSYPSGLAVNGTTAYWAQGNSIFACSITGCGGTPTTIASLPASHAIVEAIAVDATDVYFGSTDGPSDAPWEIRRCPRSGCAAGSTLLSSTPSGQGGPVGEIAVDATRIYFASGDCSQILALAK
jgi:hypothetical protein